MPLTRAQAEAALIGMAGRSMAACNLDGTTRDGTNADLNWPLTYSMIELGLAVVDPSAVSDADLAAVRADGLNQLLDVAKLRVLEACLDNLDDVSVQTMDSMEKAGEFRSGLETSIERQACRCRRQYGVGLAAPTGGTMTLDFAEDATRTIYQA